MAVKEADDNDEDQDDIENVSEEKPRGRKLGSPIKKKKKVLLILTNQNC